MDANALPTKRNLLQAKHNLALSRKGHNLLDMRHKALLHELSDIKKKADLLREELHNDIINSYRDLAIAQMEIGGVHSVFFWNIFLDDNGKGLNQPRKPPYGLSHTSAALDEAFIAWLVVITKAEKLAEAEATIRRLYELIRRTRKRAAALRNITIPAYEARVKYILEQLEERERDELVRIKTAKKSKKRPLNPSHSL